eukprot:CAMPEP_0181196088 /NCGR_PEP_ID=MMETSP1096-20121128/15258_1 /TAXON_ID=156174 ORGANISM="Chrysochromulina ericina, Strain CCMP281" /NCGR_SAMPLE_ID=MMETSP1096 /ASSEMBLY_ACC=CAM_ASM_000453 /LENGTH=152 /DNA_ID=CAMNT_0023285783 /DNA_START=130 /DNA_END=589 /DNA_ORIENTATION=+
MTTFSRAEYSVARGAAKGSLPYPCPHVMAKRESRNAAVRSSPAGFARHLRQITDSLTVGDQKHSRPRALPCYALNRIEERFVVHACVGEAGAWCTVWPCLRLSQETGTTWAHWIEVSNSLLVDSGRALSQSWNTAHGKTELCGNVGGCHHGP